MSVIEAKRETIGAKSRRITQAPQLVAPPRPLLMIQTGPVPTVSEEKRETIGSRGRRVATERGTVRQPEKLLVSRRRPEAPRNTDLATHLYTPPAVPDRLSNLPVGRHRPEYVRSQGKNPIEMLAERTKNYTGRHHLPSEPEAQIITGTQARTPAPVEEPFIMSNPQPPAVNPSETPEIGRPPHVPSLPRRRRRQPNTSTTETLEVPKPDTSVKSESNPPLRSATETGIHKRKKTKRPKTFLAATTAAIVLTVALGGVALALLKDKKTIPPAPHGNLTEVIISDPPRTGIPEPLPIVIRVTEPGIISARDGNQWNAAASKVREALDEEPSNGVTNIVAKVGAYDSRSTSPDPDAADAGDAFLTLTDSAIEVVDRLQEAPEPTASEAEQEAARIIHRLNSLNSMETKTFIQHYGSEIEALKQHLTTILTPSQESNKISGISQVQEIQSSLVIPYEAEPEKDKVKPKTVFSRAIDKAKSIIKPDIQTKGRKAIAALAKDRDRRQAQRSTI